jgi:hypothetical protein
MVNIVQQLKQTESQSGALAYAVWIPVVGGRMETVFARTAENALADARSNHSLARSA